VGRLGEGATWAVSREVGSALLIQVYCADMLFIFCLLFIYLINILHIQNLLLKIIGTQLNMSTLMPEEKGPTGVTHRSNHITHLHVSYCGPKLFLSSVVAH